MGILPANADSIRTAGELLRTGQLVGIPTETVYGLAANAFDDQAVAKIFALKQRPAFDPLIVHLSDVERLDEVAENVPASVRVLIDHFWPGPLTVVLRKRTSISDLVTSGLETVAVRVPAHEVARSIIAEAGVPLAAPSANLFGRISPTMAEHVEESFGNTLPLVVDGGPCEIGVESTVIDCSEEDLRLLRPGGVTLESLQDVVGEIAVGVQSSAKLNAPGQLAAHYAPRTKLEIQDPVQAAPKEKRWGLLWHGNDPAPAGYEVIINLSPSEDDAEAAAALFRSMRILDAHGVDRIVARAFSEVGLGRAIMDRLRRAAVGSGDV